ncbi:1-(5-phosphoribosyl)-5-[(5-phosphoribosylamino)methylideneamino]imidazole-4-carboxamide isomerase [Candidatus Bathyarchaeota archaeon]|nr:1-(5-phosphoribosyl)-5-[(5-phosphoribosylamino)methylideneamino]imidazole-4-carboxamide isomerase [Candidatus Bathyarchaeota archaeon]
MKIFPAVDIMDGKVVRLFKGLPETAKTYIGLENPVAVAKKWENEGADGLHVVDLDAALGRGDNSDTIFEIARNVKIPVHVGGGIRSEEMAEKFLSMGIDKIIIGTLAFKKSKALVRLVERFGDHIVIALDYKENGKVMIEGWRETVELGVEDAIQKFQKLKVKTFLLTSVSRNGTLKGVSVNIVKKACTYKEARVIAAGGIQSLNDLALLKSIGVYGVVIGKALYEGIFSLKEALKIAREG